jgi:hypothetical protein
MPKLYYRISDPSDVRELGEQMAEWQSAGNPKAYEWTEQPAAPTANAVWTNGEWIIPPLPTYTAEGWVEAEGFYGNRPTTLLYLKLKLDASDKYSPALDAVQGWLDGMIFAGVTNSNETRDDWPSAPYSFERASGEALAILAEV